MRITPETPHHHAQVHSLLQAAFERDSEANLVAALRRNPAAYIPDLSLIATEGSQVTGHILFTRIHIQGADGMQHECLALAPLAVQPERQRSGIGSELVRAGLQAAAQMGYVAVIVLGHREYYPRFGFAPASKWGIRAPFEVKEASFMAQELMPGALEGKAGTVVYPAEFAGV